MGRDFGELMADIKGYDPKRITEEAIDLTVDRLADLNRDQLREGLGSDGGRFRRYRSPSYAAYKEALNPVPGYGNPDYILTGAFSAEIRAERQGDQVEITSYNSKAPALEAREEANGGADHIYGPTAENQERYVVEDLAPAMIERFRKEINL